MAGLLMWKWTESFLCALTGQGLLCVFCAVKKKKKKKVQKTFKHAEKLTMHQKLYKRTLIITCFGHNLRFESTGKRKL